MSSLSGPDVEVCRLPLNASFQARTSGVNPVSSAVLVTTLHNFLNYLGRSGKLECFVPRKYLNLCVDSKLWST